MRTTRTNSRHGSINTKSFRGMQDNLLALMTETIFPAAPTLWSSPRVAATSRPKDSNVVQAYLSPLRRPDVSQQRRNIPNNGRWGNFVTEDSNTACNVDRPNVSGSSTGRAPASMRAVQPKVRRIGMQIFMIDLNMT